MKRAATGMLLLALAAGAARAATDGQSFDQIARGRDLAAVGDCAACHTAPGGKPYAGGRKLATPFGTLLAPNLTPDRATGIGAWSDDQFVDAVRNGMSPGGVHLYPAMPYPNYTKLTRADALAIRAYLATLEPVHNKVVANQLPFPYDIRFTMAVWDWLYFSPGSFQPDAGKSAAWNRGAYLVEGPGHCGVCHTAKNFLGADKTSRALEGGTLQGWFAPELTDNSRTGLGNWSATDIADYLKTGHNRFAAATGPMAEVITDSTSQLSQSDLAAIAAYLKGIASPQGTAPTPVAAADPEMQAGKSVYADNCSACHGPDGAGVAGLFPALKGSPSVQSARPTDLVRVLLEGAQSVATDGAPTGASMPAFGWKLSDDEVASVTTYIRNSWGNAAARVSADEVRQSRQQLHAALR
jgi:mono/diheme cytochrome c family protein